MLQSMTLFTKRNNGKIIMGFISQIMMIFFSLLVTVCTKQGDRSYKMASCYSTVHSTSCSALLWKFDSVFPSVSSTRNFASRRLSIMFVACPTFFNRSR